MKGDNFYGNSTGYDTTDKLTIRTINYNDLSDDTQKYIWQAFYTWWAKGALNLIADSYGTNYKFGSDSKYKELYFGFINKKSPDGGYQTALTESPEDNNSIRMAINLVAYGSLKNGGNPDGESNNKDVPVYLDRTIAHEMTHAVMSANINNYYSLPQFIKEGIAELTIGVDDLCWRLYVHALFGKASGWRRFSD